MTKVTSVIQTGGLAFREFVMQEPLPLTTIQQAILEFLRGRDDAVLFGAQAVNAYVAEPRASDDIDLLSPRASELAEELRDLLQNQFHIAVRIREIGQGRGYRIYQVQKSGNRHLVDLRPVVTLPPAQRIAQVLVATPEELIVQKIIAYQQRRGKPKSGTDWRDLAMLLLQFPEFKRDPNRVTERLRASGAGQSILAAWQELVAQEIQPAEDEDGF